MYNRFEQSPNNFNSSPDVSFTNFLANRGHLGLSATLYVGGVAAHSWSCKGGSPVRAPTSTKEARPDLREGGGGMCQRGVY